MSADEIRKLAESGALDSAWYRIEREVKRYINEGNDFFTVELGGFEVKFDWTKGADSESAD